MPDIEADAVRSLNGDSALSGDSTSIAGRSSSTRGFEGNRHLHSLREKLSRGRLRAKVRQRVSHMKERLQKEIKEATMGKSSSTWSAKWMHKVIKRLDWVNGDVGYSTEIPVRVTRRD
jgi:hypothetical protein